MLAPCSWVPRFKSISGLINVVWTKAPESITTIHWVLTELQFMRNSQLSTVTRLDFYPHSSYTALHSYSPKKETGMSKLIIIIIIISKQITTWPIGQVLKFLFGKLSFSLVVGGYPKVPSSGWADTVVILGK